MDHLATNKLLSDTQYGFRSGRSCVLQLLEVLDEWLKTIDNGDNIGVAYLDFRKAFDSVPSERLLTKNNAMGIRGKIGEWLSSFLLGTKHRVIINECSSEWLDVTSGILQGSVLEPILFLIYYINDMPDQVYNNIYLFADDATVSVNFKDVKDCSSLQLDLNNLNEWSKKCQLYFNVNKCKVMYFGYKNPSTNYVMGKKNEECVEEDVTHEKDLGVIIQSDLQFSMHIAKKVKKTNIILGLIKKSFTCMDEDMFRCLYTALFKPHLEYATCVRLCRFTPQVE